MKKIFLLIVLTFAFSTVYAQTVNTIKITEHDGTEHTVLVGNAATITFSDQHTLAIGEWFEGGIIFYIDGTGEHGLVAAASDQSSGIIWWTGSNLVTGATGAGVEDGANNTSLIVATQGAGSYAAQLCNDLTLNGFSDWFLPSEGELDLMHQNKTTINNAAALRGGSSFGVGIFYWSSTEFNGTYARQQHFSSDASDGLQQTSHKSSSDFRVRAVRAF